MLLDTVINLFPKTETASSSSISNLNPIIAAIITTLGAALAAYFGSYYNTKRANKALIKNIGELTTNQQNALNESTLKYIGAITEIEEKVRNEFINQNNIINAKLSFSNQHTLNLMALEREAIFDFNKKFCLLNQLFFDISFEIISINSLKDLDEKKALLFKTLSIYNSASDHLYLFYINDVEYVEKLNELNLYVLNYFSFLSKALGEIGLQIIVQERKMQGIFADSPEGIRIAEEIEEKIDKIQEEFNEATKNSGDLIKSSYFNLINYLSNKFKA